MFLDSRQLDDDAEIQVDVCIVGAGAAGITLAREFLGQTSRVAVLTSGDFRFRRQPQALYAGDTVGSHALSTYRSRVRMYGGSTTRWTGQCRPLERVDFEKRAWVPHSGWPFSLDHLEPFYRRAHEVCALGPFDYRPEAWSENGPGVLPLEPGRLGIRVYQFSRTTDFGKAYRGELSAARNVVVYLRSNVVEVEVDPDVRRVTGLRVATFSSKRARFVADRYVLACGGIENPRLLLASNTVATRGLANEHDLVGRFYTDHPLFFGGHFEPSKPAHARTLHVIEDYEQVGSEQKAVAALALPEETIRAEGLNDCVVYLVRRAKYKTRAEYYAEGVKSLTQIADILKREDLADRHFARHLRNVAAGMPEIGSSLARRLAERVRPQPRLALRTALETTPNPDSRVSLGQRRDRFGMPRVEVDWRLNGCDRRGMERLYEVMREEFDRFGLGLLVQDLSEDATGWPASMTSGMHHMGTTRMHDDPRKGVVDANCRVHGLANLYVAGSSVFPTGGVANPTLTIVALAIRLADHMKQRIESASPG